MKNKRAQTYMGAVRVGPKGQIVIPKEVRDMFEIAVGESLMILADSRKGIALEKQSTLVKMAEAIFADRAKELPLDGSEEDIRTFAAEVTKKAKENPSDECD